jgi:hypothetical protein
MKKEDGENGSDTKKKKGKLGNMLQKEEQKEENGRIVK